MNYLIQGIGLLGTVLYFASFQCRENKKAAAEKVLDENWLPSHSEAYREAYKPAYRVLHTDYRKFRRGEEE